MKKRTYLSSYLYSEKEYLVDKVSEWEVREGEDVVKKGWKYEGSLSAEHLKFSVMIESQYPVITQEEIDEKGSVTVKFYCALIRPYVYVSNGSVYVCFSVLAKKAKLVC